MYRKFQENIINLRDSFIFLKTYYIKHEQITFSLFLYNIILVS